MTEKKETKTKTKKTPARNASPSDAGGPAPKVKAKRGSKKPEALAVIDKGLAELLHRELVSTNEVADLLLDVRMLLAASEGVAVN